MGGCGELTPDVGVVCMLECAEGKFAGWKRGNPGSCSEPDGPVDAVAECCLDGRSRDCCAADMLVPLSSRRGELGCLVGRYADGDWRPFIFRFRGGCKGDIVGDGRVSCPMAPRDGAVSVVVLALC
jgi:hypothetical protein